MHQEGQHKANRWGEGDSVSWVPRDTVMPNCLAQILGKIRHAGAAWGSPPPSPWERGGEKGGRGLLETEEQGGTLF